MISVRLKKVARDFGVRWGRTLMAFTGLTIGLFVAGAVVAAYSLLRTDLDAGYRRTTPPNLVLRTDAVPPEVLRRLAALPGVAALEERPLVRAGVQTEPGHWWPLELAVVDDFRDLRVATFAPDAGLPEGAWPPPTGGLLLERDGRYFMEGGPGAALHLRFADGGTASGTFSGYVFDPGQHPSRMEMVLYGYVTRATLAAWGQALDGTRLLLTTRASGGPESASALAPVVESTLVAAGVAVRRLDIQDVPVYGHQNQLDALLVLMAGLALTTLVMGTVLVVNLIDGMMTRERRVVGVMRALGAAPGQVLRDYLLGTGALGLAAALTSLWPAVAMGMVTARFVAAGNNFDLVTPRPPLWVAAIILIFGAGTPLTVTAWRVGRMVRLPVRLALMRSGGQGGGVRVEMLGRATILPLLPRLAVGAVLRRPRPAVLSALVLAIGLAFFLTALNVRASMQGTAAAVARTKPYDVQLLLRQPHSADRLRFLLAGRPEVRVAEYWRAVTAIPLGTGGGRLGNAIPVVAAPADTRLLRPDLLAGRWLAEGALDGMSGGVVVTQKLLADMPAIQLGGAYQLRAGDRVAPVTIIGVVREFGPGRVYAPAAVMDALRPSPADADLVYLTLAPGTDQRQAAQALQDDLTAAGIQVGEVETAGMLRAIIDGHLDFITFILLAISVLALLTGVLGLAACIGVSVAERIREIGVMKAMGASGSALVRLFIYEAVVIAVLGWAIASAWAPLISRPVVARFGQRIIQYPFDYQACAWGAAAGLGVAILIAVLATLVPAQAAVRATVAKTLRVE
ncbi:ABC transporter permease [Nitrospirillum pindoramense]|uniref:ABC-type lipoprotein release transport system permease subunit n=1 Tax=Nitrospirillum amazonense TaxID=28077 RepID=A0A560GP25_9PROT|nr:ABC transporter permease [Nitrospirillum amazonense]TWB35753.1 ABC-type lipoprotein release transport system permease subunit [Nitrospirillum amazonense]